MCTTYTIDISDRDFWREVLKIYTIPECEPVSGLVAEPRRRAWGFAKNFARADFVGLIFP
jgi:hypothetical protein